MIRRPPRSTLFPTRRSSDLFKSVAKNSPPLEMFMVSAETMNIDRKSTRLNSSHRTISYAVFCLKKKKKIKKEKQIKNTTTKQTQYKKIKNSVNNKKNK